MTRIGYVLAMALLGLAGLPSSAGAQAATDWPQRPVRIIVGFAPGGSVDLMARFFGKKLGERLGQSFVVENRAGAGGNIGADVVAKARPDGYTLLMTSVVHSVNPSLFSTLPFDPVKDFAPVSPIGLAPNGIAVNVASPFKTLGDVVAYAKAHPGEVSYASAGGGTLMYLGMALFESMAGVKMLHVPYNGAGPSVQAAVGNQVQVLSSGYGSAEPFVRSGQLRMLGISTASPSPMAPGVPTIAEAAGLPGYEVVNWIGLFAPAGTPPAIVAKLNQEIGEIQKLPDVRQFMPQQGVDPFYLTPAAFGDLVRDDIGKYRKIVEATGAKPQ